MESPPDLETAYRTYRRLLFGAFSRASAGDPVGLDEGFDLVHDFFLDEYDDLRARFDPARAQFSTLLYGAFQRYVRRRLPSLRRWQAALLPGEDLDELESIEPIQGLDVRRISLALAELSADARALLRERFEEGRTERELGRRRGWTRYRAREETITALARLLVALGDRGELDDRDWRIAHALWAEERSVADAATANNVSREQVRRATARVLQTISRSLSRGTP